MAISAQVSLWGLYQLDSSILDGLIVPTGMDGDNLKQNLLLETESMEILYPNAPFLKAAIYVWAAERKSVWDKLYATTVLDYNPIENYDRIQDDTGSATDHSSGTSTGSSTGRSSGSNTATAANTAYNSDTFKDTAKNISSGSTDTLSSNTAQSSGESSRSNTFHSRVHGNIGVTTTQQMLQSEREVAQFCMTEFIINDFIERFCVGVY